jgi:hypothetical protein
MAEVMPWGENITVFLELSFRVNRFIIGSPTLGVIGEDYIGGEANFPDVTEFVQGLSISRGRPDQLQQFNAGTASITLNNTDRRFDPTNTDSPYYDILTERSGLTPRRRVFIFSDNEPLFYGSITDIDIEYKPQSATASIDISTVTISASDDFVLLANTNIYPEYETTQTTSGFRLFTILGIPSVNFPSYNYDTSLIFEGVAVLGGSEFDEAFTISSGTNALQYVQKIGEAEQGYVFMSKDGMIKFVERLEPQYQTSVATFSDDGTGIPYNTLSVAFGQESLYNNIIVSNPTGLEYEITDTASETLYKRSTLDLSDTLLAGTDNTEQLELVARNLLLRYKKPEYRFDKMTVTYNGLSDAQQNTLSELELADIITITRNYVVGSPSSVTQQYSVESLNHRITASTHQLEIGLAVAPLAYPLILDDLVFGTLSEANALD